MTVIVKISFSFLFLKLKGREKLEQLKEVLEKGFEDLRSMDLIDENDEPTEACMARGIYLDQYQKAFSHCEVDPAILLCTVGRFKSLVPYRN